MLQLRCFRILEENGGRKTAQGLTALRCFYTFHPAENRSKTTGVIFTGDSVFRSVTACSGAARSGQARFLHRFAFSATIRETETAGFFRTE